MGMSRLWGLTGLTLFFVVPTAADSDTIFFLSDKALGEGAVLEKPMIEH
jgi:hypothetical protein